MVVKEVLIVPSLNSRRHPGLTGSTSDWPTENSRLVSSSRFCSNQVNVEIKGALWLSIGRKGILFWKQARTERVVVGFRLGELGVGMRVAIAQYPECHYRNLYLGWPTLMGLPLSR